LIIIPMIATVLQVVDVEPCYLITYSAGLITVVLGSEITLNDPGEDYVSGGYQPDLS